MSEDNNQKPKTFGRLAFERLISNLLSVKVWLFLIPLILSCGFLYWVVGLITETHLAIIQSFVESSEVSGLAVEGMKSITEIFTSWLKFTGSLVVSVIGVREIWKINKIREETKRNGKKGE